MAAAAHCTTATIYTKKHYEVCNSTTRTTLYYNQSTRHLSTKAVKPQCTIIKSNYRLNSMPASLHELAAT